MKKYLIILLVLISFQAFTITEDYRCSVRQYTVYITITQDTSTSMWLSEYHNVLAMGYAKSIERKDGKTIYHFYPQLGPTDYTFKTQDTIDLPKKLSGWIHVNAPFFVLWDKLECTRTY